MPSVVSMARLGANWRILRRAVPLAALALALGPAAAWAASPFAFGAVDPTSPVAADVKAAERAPGRYPKFSEIPPVPKDVRPATAWRAAVYDEWALKQRTEAEAAALPFALDGKDTQAWAQAELAKIPPAEMIPPAADSAARSEAYAAAARGRATPPPSSK
jgi:hypothetical protein